MTDHVHKFSSSLEDERPEIDFRMKCNQYDWTDFNRIMDGDLGVQFYSPVQFTIGHSDALLWDFYSVAGTLGLISDRAVRLIGESAFRNFDLLIAHINTAPYYFMRPAFCPNYLDIEKSEVRRFPHAPYGVMRIIKHAFKKNIIPEHLVFCIPEGGSYCTSSVVAAIGRHEIRGISTPTLD